MSGDSIDVIEQSLCGLAARLAPSGRRTVVNIRASEERFAAIAADAEILLRCEGIAEGALRQLRYSRKPGHEETTPARVAAAVRQALRRRKTTGEKKKRTKAKNAR